MDSTARYLKSFESVSGSVVATFPLSEYSWTSTPTYRKALGLRVGLDWAHDFSGVAPRLASPVPERIQFLLDEDDDDAVDLAVSILDFLAKCHNIGYGFLVMEDSAGDEYIAEARAMDPPSYNIAIRQGLNIPLSVSFERNSWWHPALSQTISQKVDNINEDFNINCEGTLPTNDIVFRFRADSNGTPITSPIVFTNTTNGLTFTLDITFTSIDEEERVDCGAYTVRVSTNNGVDYTSDSGVLTLPADQGQIMRFEPGVNAIEIDSGSSPDYTVEIEIVPNFA